MSLVAGLVILMVIVLALISFCVVVASIDD